MADDEQTTHKHSNLATYLLVGANVIVLGALGLVAGETVISPPLSQRSILSPILSRRSIDEIIQETTPEQRTEIAKRLVGRFTIGDFWGSISNDQVIEIFKKAAKVGTCDDKGDTECLKIIEKYKAAQYEVAKMLVDRLSADDLWSNTSYDKRIEIFKRVANVGFCTGDDKEWKGKCESAYEAAQYDVAKMLVWMLSVDDLWTETTNDQARGIFQLVADLEFCGEILEDDTRGKLNEECLKHDRDAQNKGIIAMLKARGVDYWREISASVGYLATPIRAAPDQVFMAYVCSQEFKEQDPKDPTKYITVKGVQLTGKSDGKLVEKEEFIEPFMQKFKVHAYSRFLAEEQITETVDYAQRAISSVWTGYSAAVSQGKKVNDTVSLKCSNR